MSGQCGCHIKGERRAVHPDEEAQARRKAWDIFEKRHLQGYSLRDTVEFALDAYRAELTLQALRRLGVRGTL